jgi:cytochrome c553
MFTQKLIFTVPLILLLAAGTIQAGGDPARGAELALDCADCHGDDGLGDEYSPAIAGLDENAMVAELKAFKSGERVDEDEMMIDYVEDLSDQDMANLAAYYSSLPAE